MRILISNFAVLDREGFSRSFSIARTLAGAGHDVTLLTSQPAGARQSFPFRAEKRGGARILAFPDVVPHRIRKMGLGPLNLVLRLAYAFRNRFDVVQADAGHRPVSGLPCLLNRRLWGSRYVSEWWEDFGRDAKFREKPWWYRLTLARLDIGACRRDKRTADGVVCLSSRLGRMARDLGVPERNIGTVPGGADVEAIAAVGHTRRRAEFGVPAGALTFCYVGIGETELRQDLPPFVEAFNRLKSEHPLFMITTGGRLSREIREEYGIGNEWRDFGWVDYSRLSAILSCADCCVLVQKDNPANRARWPAKIGDYFSAGRRVMANPVGDVAGLMKAHPRCFVPVDWNGASIGSAMASLAGRRGENAGGRECRRVAETEMAWKIRVEALVALYGRTRTGPAGTERNG
jgi:hypothetical protein